MTDGERLDALHTKMADRRRKKERRMTFAAGAGCAVSAAGLGVLIIDGTAHTSGTAGTYSGAAMLFDGSGIYVLIAVIAFSLGAALTVLLIRSRPGPGNGGMSGKDDDVIPPENNGSGAGKEDRDR